MAARPNFKSAAIGRAIFEQTDPPKMKRVAVGMKPIFCPGEGGIG